MTRALALAALTAVAACTSPPDTEMVVLITSDLPPEQIRSAQLFVLPSDADTPELFRTACTRVGAGGASLPLSVGLEPAGAATRPFRVYARAFSDASCTLANRTVEQSATVTFVPKHRLLLELQLNSACTGVSCPAGLTCKSGTPQCEDDRQATLPDYSPNGGLPDLASPSNPSDGGPSDGGTSDGGPSICDQHNFYLCNGFESATGENGLEDWIWYQPGADPLYHAMADTTRPYRGARSAHLQIDPTAQFGNHWLGHGFGGLATAYVRTFFYAPNAGYIAGLRAPDSTSVHIGLSSTQTLQLYSDVIAGRGYLASLSPNAWHCLEYQWNPSTNQLTFWVDEQLIEPGVTIPKQFDTVELDAQSDGNTSTYDIWFDEVVIDGDRIGCGQ